MVDYGSLYRAYGLLQEKDKNTIEVVTPKEKTGKEKVGDVMVIISRIIMFNSLFAFACTPAWLLFTEDVDYMIKSMIISSIILIYGICMYTVGKIIRDED